METIEAADFKARRLAILDHVSAAGEHAVILKRGRPQALDSARPKLPPVVSESSLRNVVPSRGLGRIRLAVPSREWLERATAGPVVRRQGISPAIATELAVLPDSFHRDPADRILVATSRVLGAILLAQARRVAESGLVKTLGREASRPHGRAPETFRPSGGS